MDVEEALPPGTVVTSAGAVVLFTGDGLVDEVLPLNTIMDHAVDGTPVGKTTEVAIVDKYIDLQLATEVVVVGEGFLGIVAIDGIELDASLPTPVDRLIEQLAFADTPEDQLVMLGDEHAEGLDGERNLGANLGVTVLDDRSVKINCN